jgi:hypothetical protein
MKYCNCCGIELVIGKTWTEARKKHHMNSCNACNHKKSKLWKQENTKKAAQSAKYTKLKYHYNLSKEQFDFIYESQQGKCAICLETQDKFSRNLHVDHCHTTGKVRGLLCSNCNTAIGKLKENIIILDRAKEYIIRNTE